MATPEMLQPTVQLIELEQDQHHLLKGNKFGIRQDVSSIFGKKYKPKIIISSSGMAQGGEGEATRPFACMFCPAAFKSEAALVSHVRVHVNASGVANGVPGGKQIVHSCVYCNRSFKQATNLEIHMRTYHPYGDGSSASSQQLNYPGMNQAASYMMNQAGLALWEYKNQEQLQTLSQQQGDSGEPSEGQTSEPNSSHEHSIVVVKAEKAQQEFATPDASGGTVSWEKVSRDLTAYAVERPFTCDYCNKCFKQEAHLKQHVRIHTDDRPYGCSYCGKAFRQKAVLNQHVRLHTGEKPYHCNHCGDKFRQMTTLKLHTRKHLCDAISSGSLVGSGYRDIIRLMKGPPAAGVSQSEHEEAANVLSAQIAQMQQAAAGGHTNGSAKGPGRGRGGSNVGRPRGSHPSTDSFYYMERPFACPHCNKCFKQEAHLKLHERTHSDYRPFACGYCGKAFRLKAILQQHERLHTGEKPYACGQCGEAFRQMTTLKLHMRKHEAEVALSGGRETVVHSSGDEGNHAATEPHVVVVMQTVDASGEGVTV